MMTGPLRRKDSWLRILAIAFIVSVTEAGEPTSEVRRGPALHRHKRAWNWQALYTGEENIVTTPVQIGKLRNNKSNEYTQFIIQGEGANSIFVVNQQGDVFVTQKLDRETKSVYRLRAKLIDSITKHEIEAASDFEIHVQDINDNAPEFQGPFNGSIEEMSKEGTPVLTVKATDKDDPTIANGKVEYKLLTDTDIFAIDQLGVIRSRVTSLDREFKSQYKVAVQAKDMYGQTNGFSVTSTITITVTDINDNLAYFPKQRYTFDVREDEQPVISIGIIEVEDKDEEQNKDPTFSIPEKFSEIFQVIPNQRKDGNLRLKKALDYEQQESYTFSVFLTEQKVKLPPGASRENRAEVVITVIDVDEPPVFTRPVYNISVQEERFPFRFPEIISAKDPDKINHRIRYYIEDNACPIAVDADSGQMSLKWKLDRESLAFHVCQVVAEEKTPNGKRSSVTVNLVVMDINDNEPKLMGGDVFVCDSDNRGTVIGTITATDKDELNGVFHFRLAKPSSNFSLSDNNNGTATLTVKNGKFSTEDSADHILEIEITDGGTPLMKSIDLLAIKVCQCNSRRSPEYCRPARATTGVSVHALIAILLCIVTILVIVILIVLRRRYRKDSLVALGKASGEIHEQLVTYDEEGGGEMDTNGYDVSILTSARHDGTMLPEPSLYSIVKKPPACKGDMAMMIEVKKDEADHDRDGIPYDTLHIYGYEGPGSLAGSLSSLESSSTDGSLDYDFLCDWGPRFRTLAELYGVDGSDSDCPY
ncbi:cadherin-5 [Denticeps clupeoides]|uniref:cadherin-5 n=1 Tax=Denticeps clupeoides TaxID=299321 RepID=UPI0010A412C7|nr:cadherin-5-like [Denticeps clupeoides]